ncbi:MAG: hypothetical protein K6E83_10560 [Clostridium sp.]|nr:hypothetical protein [Clostridium sp.]
MNGLLKKTVELAKTGSGDGYEDFYILTVDSTYGKIKLLGLTEEQSEGLLADVYTNLYRHVHELPLEEEQLDAMMEEEIRRAAAKLLGDKQPDIPLEGEFPKLAEDVAAGIWIRVENRTGLYSDRRAGEKTPWYAYAAMGIRIVLAVVMLVLIAAVFFMLWRYLAG